MYSCSDAKFASAKGIKADEVAAEEKYSRNTLTLNALDHQKLSFLPNSAPARHDERFVFPRHVPIHMDILSGAVAYDE